MERRTWSAALQREGKSGRTVRHYLNTLSNLYRRARAEEIVSPGYNPVAERGGWKAGEITPKQFRHTYTAARLQTLDQGGPVSDYTVAKELGHGSVAMVEGGQSHLGAGRHRSEPGRVSRRAARR